MSKHSGNGRIGLKPRANRAKSPLLGRTRRVGFETLEDRRLLSVAAPTSIAFEPQSNQGTATLTSANNSSTSAEMQFLVSGVTAGDTVNVYADGGTTAIGTGTVASGNTTITVTTNGTSTLTNGTHTFTATQTDTSSNVSASSPSTSVQVFANLTLTSGTAEAATVGQAFTYTVQNNVPSDDTVTVTPGTLPTGMTYDSTTETFTWTPTSDQGGTTQSIPVTLSDTAGNTPTITVFVGVAATSGVTALAPPSTIAIGSPVLVALNSADSGSPTFSVTTSSTSDPHGNDLTATVMPQTNQVLKIVTNEGEMDFQLLNNYTPNTVAHFESLVDSGTYNQSTYANLSGTFELQVGSTTTAAITFDSSNPTATAANIQSALVSAGFSGATVSVDSTKTAPDYGFNVTFAASESPIAYVATATPLEVNFANSVSAAAATQELTFSTRNPDFYRIIQTFMDQGGVGGTGSTIPVELNSLLRFTSSGLLSMANNGVDGNTSEFFITNPDDMSNAFLDFHYTIFGKLIAGDYVRQAIAATPVTTNSSGEDSQPLTPPIIESMSIATETSNGVVLLDALPGATGTYTVNVSDGLGGTTSFTITLGTNADDPPNPWVQPINGTDTIHTAANTPYTFTPTGGYAAAAGAVAPQINVQTFLPVPAVTGAVVDSSYDPLNSTFELQVGSVTTGSISFDSSNLTGTAANIRDALVSAGFSGATVTAISPTGSAPTAFSFKVTFAASESPIASVSSAALPDTTLTNSATSSTTVQTLTFTTTIPVPDTTNPDITLTQSGTSFTVTPAAGYYGMQVLEVTGFTPVSGTFELQVGSTTTAAITFNSGNLAATAANIQSALVSAGFSGATVTVGSTTTSPNFNFNVLFAADESPLTYVAAATALPVTFTNSASSATSAVTQELTFTATGAAWDSGAGVSPVYRAFVPVYVTPPTPQIASISVGSQTVSGSTFANNASAATALTFHISGVVSGATVSVYVNGGATPIATGTVASGATYSTLTTDGKTPIADGNDVFTVVQSFATSAVTLYADWSGGSPGTEYSIAAGTDSSPASAGTALAIGLVVLAQPASSVQVGVLYTYVVQTNAPSGDTVTVTPVTLPTGMQFNGSNTFTWTPTSGQLNTAPAFEASVTDSLGNSVAIGPLDISVIIGLAPVQVPVNSSKGGSVTVLFSGSQAEVYDNIGKTFLSKATFKSTDTITLDLPAGQANSVLVLVPASASAAIPKEVLVQGTGGSTNNQVTVYGTKGANNFILAGGTATDNGLATQIANVQTLTLAGFGGNDYYRLDSSTTPTWVVDTGGYNTMDFSHDTAGVTVNLGLDKGQAQTIAPWNTPLMIYGVINKLIGSNYADVLTGGPAATTEIVGGSGNDRIIGGSGDNILVGGGGNDTIIGGLGRNLMIAGSGTCNLYANGRQNMVFAGSTNDSSNDQALLNLLDEGPLVMYSYLFRRALASSAKNPSLLANMLSFQDSGAHDTVFGSSSINNMFVLGKNSTLRS